jgi:hypothetical protein
MSVQTTGPVALTHRSLTVPAVTPDEGLLITADGALARAFLQELRRCADCSAAFDVRATLSDASELASERHRWVAIDLGGPVAPAEAVGLARRLWPVARIGVLSGWWSEHDAVARSLADVVIHKPIRAPELAVFLRADPAATPGLPTQQIAPPVQLRNAG